MRMTSMMQTCSGLSWYFAKLDFPGVPQDPRSYIVNTLGPERFQYNHFGPTYILHSYMILAPQFEASVTSNDYKV